VGGLRQQLHNGSVPASPGFAGGYLPDADQNIDSHLGMASRQSPDINHTFCVSWALSPRITPYHIAIGMLLCITAKLIAE
jgi:hypothetical protein